jgi:translation initiation factor IF-3
LIDAEGEQVGILKFEDAMDKAKAAGLDLVVVADQATPPVFRIMDFGKLVYEQKRKLREQRRQQVHHKLKEVKFKVRIEEHDYQFKIAHAVDFLSKGSQVKVSLQFRGREMAHKELGFELVNRVIEDLKPQSTADGPARMMGRSIIVNLTPAKK